VKKNLQEIATIFLQNILYKIFRNKFCRN